MVTQGSSCFLPVIPPARYMTNTIATKRKDLAGGQCWVFLKARLGCSLFISTLVHLIKIQLYSPNPTAEEIRKYSLPEYPRIGKGNRIGKNITLFLSIKLQIKLLNRYLRSTVIAMYVGHHKQNKLFLSKTVPRVARTKYSHRL